MGVLELSLAVVWEIGCEDAVRGALAALVAAGGAGLGGGATEDMNVKPTVALRAILVGGIAVFAKIAGAAKAAGGVKLGAAAVAVTAAASATMAGSKQDGNQSAK
ncbi:hypothetical protein L1987_87881 [Smallanthus sonchifolius]|nr:hypothetical protein L1987_87881 [Smallanthus sonchifolius]